MQPARPGMEILEVRAVEPVQPFQDVLDRVAVDDVEQHAQAQAVRRVYKRFKSSGVPKRDDTAKKTTTW